jgi:hypothetical protein
MGGMLRTGLIIGLIVLGGLGFVACTRGGLPPEQVQAWVGRPAADLVKAWGAPTREVDDAGQRVLIYEEIERNTNLNFESGPRPPPGEPPRRPRPPTGRPWGPQRTPARTSSGSTAAGPLSAPASTSRADPSIRLAALGPRGDRSPA